MDDTKRQDPNEEIYQTLKQSQMGPDALIIPGLSIHFFGKTVGIYSSRITPGKGFIEMQVTDLQAIVNFLRLGGSKEYL